MIICGSVSIWEENKIFVCALIGRERTSIRIVNSLY
jgi:hypothetical protein